MSTSADTTPAPSHVSAAPRPGEVQLWSLQLETSPALLSAAAQLLTADECERMGRMRPGPARDEVILARAALRALLGRMLQCPPRSVPLTTSTDGKPQLDPRHSSSTLAFNVTHSHGHALLAFTSGVAIGVDLERIDPHIEAADIARENFAPAEQQAIASAPAAERPYVFARIWVRKEAVLKAHGAGLLLPLASFAVAHDSPAEHPIQLHDATGVPHNFFLSELPAPSGFAAALASAQPGLQLRRHELSPHLLAQLFSSNPA